MLVYCLVISVKIQRGASWSKQARKTRVSNVYFWLFVGYKWVIWTPFAYVYPGNWHFRWYFHIWCAFLCVPWFLTLKWENNQAFRDLQLLFSCLFHLFKPNPSLSCLKSQLCHGPSLSHAKKGDYSFRLDLAVLGLLQLLFSVSEGNLCSLHKKHISL